MNMRYKGIIFDLDQTLVNSSALAQLRRSRNWQAVYSRLSEIEVYDGMTSLVESLSSNGLRLCIVTSSPKPYCTRVVEKFKFPITELVCYHDTKNRKPHPEPMLKALETIGLSKDQVIAIGDELKDVQSAKAAAIFNIACLWGGQHLDEKLLASEGANRICNSVKALHDTLEELFEHPLG